MVRLHGEKPPSNTTLAGLKELGGKQQLLIWAGHGGYNRKTGSVLDTGSTPT